MRRLTLRQPLGLATLALSVLAGTGVRAQCAMCRTLLVTVEGQKLAAALRVGIVILLAAPATTFAVIAYAAVRSQRRLDADRASGAVDT
jgi:hypothetical protein